MKAGSLDECLRTLKRLGSPWNIQRYLNSLPYDPEDRCSCPVRVVMEGRAHCMEGALLAAAALRFCGHPPLIVDLRAVRDDDHVIAIFRQGGLWGALSKSSCMTLEYREPVYRSLRELVMSYFDFYLNKTGHLSLREYSRPLDLSIFDNSQWVSSDEDLGYIGEHLDRTRHYRLFSRLRASNLTKVDRTLFDASVLGQKMRVESAKGQ